MYPRYKSGSHSLNQGPTLSLLKPRSIPNLVIISRRLHSVSHEGLKDVWLQSIQLPRLVSELFPGLQPSWKAASEPQDVWQV